MHVSKVVHCPLTCPTCHYYHLVDNLLFNVALNLSVWPLPCGWYGVIVDHCLRTNTFDDMTSKIGSLITM